MALSYADIEPKDIEWFWYPYIALGKLCTIDGDPGVGKSAICCAVTASVTRGKPLPGDKHRRLPECVLMLNSEDDPNDTIRPRLDAMGADVSKVFTPPEFFTLDTDEGRSKLERTIKAVSARLVFIDPIQAWMGSKVDMNKANEVRSILGPLAAIAARTGAAIVVVRHVRKGQAGEKAIHKGLGSVDGIAAVRSGLYATSDGGRKLLRHIKSNIGPHGKTIPFEFEGTFTWGEPFDDNLTTVARKPKPLSTKPKRLDEARGWLIATLSGGRLPAAEVVARAQEKGFSLSTIQRAKSDTAVVINDNGTWYWELEHKLVVSNPPIGGGTTGPDLVVVASALPEPPIIDNSPVELPALVGGAIKW